MTGSTSKKIVLVFKHGYFFLLGRGKKRVITRTRTGFAANEVPLLFDSSNFFTLGGREQRFVTETESRLAIEEIAETLGFGHLLGLQLIQQRSVAAVTGEALPKVAVMPKFGNLLGLIDRQERTVTTIKSRQAVTQILLGLVIARGLGKDTPCQRYQTEDAARISVS